MAITVVARGTGTHNSSATTFTLSPSGNLAVGSMAVLVVAADNAHSGGDAFTTFAVSDDQANIWTRRVTPLYDPGVASDGVTGAQFTTDMAGGTLTSASVITVTFDTATTAKAWVMWEVIPTATRVMAYVASGVNTGSATTTPTVTTASITSGNVVIGGLHNEYGTAQTVTADADATNGAWSAQQAAEIGTTTTGINVASQAKVTSSTATQTYNPTLGTSSDVILSWMVLTDRSFLTVGAVDQSGFIILDSLSLKFNTFDFALKDPATIPAIGDVVTLAGPPAWTGNVASVQTTDLRLDYAVVTITATNADVALASAGPFGLSDAPNGTTTFPFQHMSVRTSLNLDASLETTGSATIFRAGLWPAMTFPLTSANRGYSAQSFTVTDVTVTWPLRSSPIYRITFGDPIVTMSVWAASQAANAPDGSISGTKITDLTIQTPKLAANSITADKMTVGARAGGSLVPNGDFEDGPLGGDPTGWTIATAVSGSAALDDDPGANGNIPISGGQSLILTVIASAGSTASAQSPTFPVSPGERLFMQAKYRSSAATSNNVTIRVHFLDAAGGLISVSPIVDDGSTTAALQTGKGYMAVPALAVTAFAFVRNSWISGAASSVVFDDVVVQRMSGGVLNSDGNVVIDSTGIAVTNGAITVTNAGATVIIDGTSDMFKIAASGTLSFAGCDGSAAQCLATSNVTLSTGFTYRPACLAFYDKATTDEARQLPTFTFTAAVPGLVTRQFGHVVKVTGGNQTNVAINWFSQTFNETAVTNVFRYYVLQEVAI